MGRKWVFNDKQNWLRNYYQTQTVKHFFNTEYYAKLHLNSGDFKLLFNLWRNSQDEYVADVLAAYLKDAGIDFEDKIDNPENYFYPECIKWEGE